MCISSTFDQQAVVLIHGLWMSGKEMVLCRLHLQKAGYRVYTFSYHTVRDDLQTSVDQLHQFLQQLDEPTIHFVAHSMGGLLVRQLFYLNPQAKPGHIVTLGTPHNGSIAADKLGSFAIMRLLLGKSLPTLLGQVPALPLGGYKLGSIAGTSAFGVTNLLVKLPLPNDGTVAETETKFAYMSDHITIAATHMGLVISATVAQQILYFLCNGRFFR